MTKRIIFCSTNMTPNSGGGVVSQHEVNACKAIGEVVLILSNTGEVYNKNNKDNKESQHISINPLSYNIINSPFMSDYLASQFIWGVEADILVTNGNPFSMTTKTFLAQNPAGKIVCDVPAHRVQDTVDEHTKVFGIDYAKQYPHEVDPFLSTMYRDHIAKADVVICPSNYSEKALNEIVDAARQVKVIPHGCDIPEKVAPLPDKVIFGHAGEYGPDKGQYYLIQAWIQLGLNTELRVAGRGATPMMEAVQSFKNRLKDKLPKSYFRFLGFIPDINVFYDNISVYVQPSVCEGFGLEVLEAMAHGRPVICSDGAGVQEIVVEGAGIIVPKRNPQALMNAMKFFYDNPDEVAKFGATGRRIAEKYTWKEIEKQYAGAIE